MLVVFCSVCANMPQDIMAVWGLDPDYFFGVLVALVVLPVGAKLSGRMR